MIKRITMFQTPDGKLFPNLIEAKQHSETLKSPIVLEVKRLQEQQKQEKKILASLGWHSKYNLPLQQDMSKLQSSIQSRKNTLRFLNQQLAK